MHSAVADPDLQIRGGGGGGHKKDFFRPFGPHFGLKITGVEGEGAGPSPRSATAQTTHPSSLHFLRCHDNDPTVLLKHHFPEIFHSSLKAALSCNVSRWQSLLVTRLLSTITYSMFNIILTFAGLARPFKWVYPLDPCNPNIKIQILICCPYTFSRGVVWTICWSIY